MVQRPIIYLPWTTKISPFSFWTKHFNLEKKIYITPTYIYGGNNPWYRDESVCLKLHQLRGIDESVCAVWGQQSHGGGAQEVVRVCNGLWFHRDTTLVTRCRRLVSIFTPKWLRWWCVVSGAFVSVLGFVHVVVSASARYVNIVSSYMT
jgi:hypothetical protein